MPSFVYSREIRLSASSLYQAIGDTLERIAAQSQADELTLRASIANTSNAVSIPVGIVVTNRSPEDLSIAFTMKARSAKSLFPDFKGTFHALAMSSARATVRLKGTYRVPFGVIGSAANAAGLHNVAEEGLRQLFERIADESIAAVREHAMRDHASQLS
jgi:hypothetical protein